MIHEREKNRCFHVPQPTFLFPLETPLRLSRKSKNRYFYHFCFPWRRPQGNHAKCCMDGKRIRCLQIVSQHVPITVSQLFEPQVQKISVFTYRSPHFCFPWRRPCDYHAICCMGGKTIQCLPNPSQHVPIYLEQLPSYTMLTVSQCVSQCAIFTTFLFPLRTPLRQSR